MPLKQRNQTKPGDVRKLAVTQTPVKKPSANVGVKILQGVK